jgi:hypothetical protein
MALAAGPTSGRGASRGGPPSRREAIPPGNYIIINAIYGIMASAPTQIVPYASKRRRLRVPVGATPGARYATWEEHRQEMKHAADEARTRALARRAA